MFYVADGKVYLVSKNFDLGVYQQVEVLLEEDGSVRFSVLMTGVTERPKGREVCTREEVIARFAHEASGASEPVHTDVEPEPTRRRRR